jgi:hypothetical protein
MVELLEYYPPRQAAVAIYHTWHNTEYYVSSGRSLFKVEPQETHPLITMRSDFYITIIIYLCSPEITE